MYFFVFGLSLFFPLRIVAFGEGSIRAPEIMIVLGYFLFLRSSFFAATILFLCSIFIFGIPGIAFLVSGDVDPSSWAFLVRMCVFSFMAPIVGCAILLDAKRLHLFGFGALVGVALSVVVLALQAMGAGSVVTSLGLSDPLEIKSWIEGARRSAGLWRHPNEAMSVIALGVCLTLALFRGRMPYEAAALAALCLAAYATMSRGGVLVSLFCLVWLWRSRTGAAKGLALYAVALIATAAALILPEWVRGIEYRMTNYTGDNASERFETWWASFVFMANQPFGNSIEAFKYWLRAEIGVTASHNSFLFIGSVLGLPCLVACVAVLISGAKNRNVIVSTCGLAVVGLYLFEETVTNSSFQISMFLFGAVGFLGRLHGSASLQFLSRRDLSTR